MSIRADQARGGFQWYVVVTHHGQERLAKANLRRQGFEVYLPMIPPSARARTRNGVPPSPRPMIPRYLFVCVDINAPGWRDILSTIGVQQLICRGSGVTARPAPIGAGFIEALQAREVAGLVVLPPPDEAKIEARYRRGDKLRLVGPTADYDVVFQEMVDGDRAKVIFKLLGVDSLQVIALPSE